MTDGISSPYTGSLNNDAHGDDFDTVDKSDGAFSLVGVNDGYVERQSMDGAGNYNWTIGAPLNTDDYTKQSFQISDDGSSHLLKSGISTTTINADGSFTLNVDSVVYEMDAEGNWSIDGESQPEGQDFHVALGGGLGSGTTGSIVGNGTFDLTHEDGSRQFLTADGTFGYTAPDGNRVQVDGDGGFIHENPDGNSLWKSAEGQIGTTENGYSVPIDDNGNDQAGSLLPYASLRGGFVPEFGGANTFVSQPPAEDETLSNPSGDDTVQTELVGAGWELASKESKGLDDNEKLDSGRMGIDVDVRRYDADQTAGVDQTA